MLATIITSSAIAAVISIVANFALRRIDYKNDYYKEIFKRRINTYAEIEDLITLYNPVRPFEGGRFCRVIFCNGIQGVINFKKQLSHIIASGLWINTNTLIILGQIEKLINQELHKPGVERDIITGGEGLSKKFREIGINRFYETSLLNKNLRESVNDDWLTLYDIRGFLKKGKRNIIWDFLLQWVIPFTIS